MIRNILKGTAKVLLGIKVPLKVQHYLTYRCNFRCKYCNLYSQESKELGTEAIKSILRDFVKAGTVSWTFTGGEPLLRKDIKELVEYAKQLGLHIAMTTNGSLVKENIDWIGKVDLLNISLDGTKEFHNNLRGKGSYDTTMGAIKLLKENHIPVAITSVMCKKSMEGNWKGLKEILGLAGDFLDIKIVVMPIYFDRYNKGKVNELMLSQSELKEGIAILREFKSRNHHKLMMSNASLDWYKGKKKMKCFAGKYYCSILPDGGVYPCLFRQENKQSINPLDSFMKLETPKGCSCNLNCYVEYNHLLSLNPKSIYEFIFQFFGGLK